MRSASNVATLHKNMARRFTNYLGYPVAIEHIPHDARWEHASEGCRVEFVMLSKKRGMVLDTAMRARGGPCKVLQVRPGDLLDPTAWLCWHEEWVAKGTRKFDRVGASWTFFWGVFNREKQQLFRADWDNQALRGAKRPQPHWHFDKEIVALVSGRRDSASEDALESEDLIELDPETDTPITVMPSKPEDLVALGAGGLHLGMSGCKHTGNHPQRWQHPAPEDKDISDWAVFTLELAIRELELLKISE